MCNVFRLMTFLYLSNDNINTNCYYIACLAVYVTCR